MGGRVYDPEIGRFLSPDPFVQFPASTQGFNRYAYVGNNPLSYTDPSGYFLKKALKIGLTIAVSYYTGAWAANYFNGAVSAGIGGAVGGYLNTGNSPGAMLGAIGGMSAFGVGSAFGHNVGYDQAGRLAAKSVSHGVTQGLISRAGGGRFGDGALGAFASSMGGPSIARAGPGIRQAMTATVVGGTASVIGGGKFANGAIAAAWVNLFNHQFHYDEQEEEVHRTSRIEFEYETIATFAERRHVPILDDLGVPDMPSVRLPGGVKIGLGWPATLANTLYFADYDVTYSETEIREIRVTTVQYGLRSGSTGQIRALGPRYFREELKVTSTTAVTSSTRVGWSASGELISEISRSLPALRTGRGVRWQRH